MRRKWEQIAGTSLFLAALIATAAFFATVFEARPHEGARGAAGVADCAAMEAALLPEAVQARVRQILDCGSRAPGQKGLDRAAAIIEQTYRDAGLECLDQDVEFAAALTEGGHGTLRVGEADAFAALPVWPLQPNHAQPVVTPEGGAVGELFAVTDASLGAALRFDDKIAVLDLAKPVPGAYGINPAPYAEHGFQAIVYTHADGLDKISTEDLRKMSFPLLPANVVRVVAESAVLERLGQRATLEAKATWRNVRTRNLVGVMRAPGGADAALVIPVYYDASSLIPDRAPGAHAALQTAIQLQLLEGLKAGRAALRRDVVFVAAAGGGDAQIGLARLLSTVGRSGGAAAEGERIAAEQARNDAARAELAEILVLFDAPAFATREGREASVAAVGSLSSAAARRFAEQFNTIMRRRVFFYAETLLQAEIAFKRNPDDLTTPAYRAFREAKRRYDQLNTLSALQFPSYLERPQAAEGGFVPDAEELRLEPRAADDVRHALRARFLKLAAHHGRIADSLARDAALQKRFAAYRQLLVVAPELNPSATATPLETLAFSSGTTVAHTSAAQSFHRLLEDAVHALGLQKRIALKAPARLSSFSAELSRQNVRLAATPWAAFSHPAFSVINPMNAYANVGDLPHEGVAAGDLASIAASMRLLGEAVGAAAGGAGTFQRLPIQQAYAIEGNVFAAAVGNSIVPNFPVEGALVVSPEKPRLFTDPYGRFAASHLIYPQDVWTRPKPIDAFYFGPGGLVTHVKDLGGAAQLVYKSTETLFDAPNNLILYRAAPVAIFDAVNPQSLRDFTGAGFIAPRGLAEFQSKSPYKDAAGMMEFIEPDQRFFVTLRAGSPENELVSTIRAFCLGSAQTNEPGFKPDRESEIAGPGYLAQDTPLLRNIGAEASASMLELAEKRLVLQRRFGMADEMTLDFQARAAESYAAAAAEGRPAMERRRGFREALAYLILNHPVIHKSITDAVWGILWYMALLVPFMFFFEKLVFGFTDIRKQLLAQAGIFLVVFGLLRLLHPAFQIVRSSMMILLGFVIILIAGSATMLLSAKFQENIDALRQAQGGVKNVEGNKTGMMATAFMLGLNNMHRRKVRTGLTCASLVLMTFVMICFSSVQSNVVNRTRALGKAAYQGLLVREPKFAPVTGGEINALKARYGHRYAVSLRQAMPGTYDPQAKTATPPAIALTAGAGADALTRKAKAALLFDAGEPLAPSIRLLTTNGWFTAAQQQLKQGPFPVMLPDTMAERLGIAAAAVDAGAATVLVNGTPFAVQGIFDSAAFAEVRDVDGESLLPFDIEALVSPQVVNNNTVLAEPSDPRVDAAEVVLLLNGHFQPADAAAIRIVSAVVDMGAADYPTARREIDAHLEQTSRQTCYGLDGVGYIARRARVRSLAGLMDLIIPLIIAGLTVLNTMKGSVYERRNEIFVYNAVGIAPRHVFAMFVAESLVYAVVGVVLGYVLAQGTGRVLTALGMTGGLNMNFTSLSTVYASLAIAAATILSTWFPARSAMEIAKPAEDAGWSLPRTEGDSLAFDLPFTFGHRDRVAVLGFFHRYFVNHGEGSAGPFFSGAPELVAAEPPGGGPLVPRLETTVWCKPFDLGVSQRIEIALDSDPATGEYISRMTLRRLTGTQDAWQRLNAPLVARIRRHFLRWRAASEQQKQDYFAEARALLEAAAASRPEGGAHG